MEELKYIGKKVRIWLLKLVNGVMVQDMILILTENVLSVGEQERLIFKIFISFQSKGVFMPLFFYVWLYILPNQISRLLKEAIS